MKLIVAVNNLGYIGKEDKMMWRCTADLKHFKTLTMRCKLLVGRKTFEGLPPLKDRAMIVVSKQNSVLYHSLEEGLNESPDWIIGGGSIYQQTAHLCDEIHMSIINDDQVGDTSFVIPESFSGKIFKYHFDVNS